VSGLLGPIHPPALAHQIRGPDPVPNFINPFWMLPLLGILGLKSKDLIATLPCNSFSPHV
jgi:short subunit fatty acids transporter